MITDQQIGPRDPLIVTVEIRPAPHFVPAQLILQNYSVWTALKHMTIRIAYVVFAGSMQMEEYVRVMIALMAKLLLLLVQTLALAKKLQWTLYNEVEATLNNIDVAKCLVYYAPILMRWRH